MTSTSQPAFPVRYGVLYRQSTLTLVPKLLQPQPPERTDGLKQTVGISLRRRHWSTSLPTTQATALICARGPKARLARLGC